MRLYRGLKSSEFKHYSDEVASQVRDSWSAILKNRAKKNWKFPVKLDGEIKHLEKLLRLQRQHFTDRRDIAMSYAKANKGLLLELDVPTADILDHFRIEFQNFGKRKSIFEIVYVVDASLLYRNRRKWRLKQIDLFKERSND